MATTTTTATTTTATMTTATMPATAPAPATAATQATAATATNNNSNNSSSSDNDNDNVNDNDNIEITNQRRLFAPHKRNLKYIVVDGFTFERCGNQYPNRFWAVKENQQAGAVGTRSGKFWKIQNNIIRFANGIGVDWGNEGKLSEDLEIGSNGKATGSYKNIITNNTNHFISFTINTIKIF